MNTTPLIAFCRALPEATEDIKWENNHVFSVHKKMFAVFDPDNDQQVCFKATPENFDMLTAQEHIVPAPYVGRYKWVLIEELEVLPHAMIEDLLHESYRLVVAKLPAKVRQSLIENSK